QAGAGREDIRAGRVPGTGTRLSPNSCRPTGVPMISLTENSRRIVRAVACALAASLLPAVASATVLYEQAPIDGGESYESVVSSSLQSADDFTLSSTQWVGGFDWWGVEAATEAFLIRIFDTTEGG